MSPTEKLAAQLYTVYCAAVGGIAFNGDSLPSWEEFAADPAKQKQSTAWMAAAHTAITTETEKHKPIRAALAGLIGADGKEELEAMEVQIRLAPIPDADRAAMVNGIHALLVTLKS